MEEDARKDEKSDDPVLDHIFHQIPPLSCESQVDRFCHALFHALFQQVELFTIENFTVVVQLQ